MSILSIDLNADLGEGAGFDHDLIPLVSSVNLCCGLHAGSLAASEAVLQLARQQRQSRDLAVGAHPGLPDRRAMGRSSVQLPPDMVGEITRYQVEILARMALSHGIQLTHLKPHGALYHLACSNPEIAGQMVQVACAFQLAVMGLPSSALSTACEGKVRFIAEGFAERGYLPDGRLIPRGQPGDLIHDPSEAAAQALRLTRQGLQTLCIHGDSPRAVAIASAVREHLHQAGYAIKTQF